jgi:hypothetical protein
MATLEHRHSILARRLPPPREEHVFAADDGRRARIVRLAGLGTAAVALVWLAALGAAMLGAERLPGVSLPSVKQVHRVSDTETRQRSPFVHPPVGRPAARAAAPRHGRSEPRRLTTQAGRVQRAAPMPAILLSPAPDAPPRASHPGPLAPAPAEAPSPPHQGWARRGWTAPPGQAKRDESVTPGHPQRTGKPASPNTIATSTQGATHGSKNG